MLSVNESALSMSNVRIIVTSLTRLASIGSASARAQLLMYSSLGAPQSSPGTSALCRIADSI